LQNIFYDAYILVESVNNAKYLAVLTYGGYYDAGDTGRVVGDWGMCPAYAYPQASGY